MNKPKGLVQTKVGTKIHAILSVLLDAKEGLFETWPKVADYLLEEYGIEYNSSDINKIVTYYNEGLYSVSGVTRDTKKILVKVGTQDFDDGQSEFGFNGDSGSEVQGEVDESKRLTTVAERCIAAGIDPSEVSNGWVKTDGLSVRVQNSTEDVEELNDLVEKAKEKLKGDILKLKCDGGLPSSPSTNNKEGILNLADLHLGAYVKDLQKTPDYSSTILCERLLEAANQVNRFGYKKVHVNILGDFVETLGMELAHSSMWKEVENGIYGFKAIQMCVEIIHEHLLSKINNLGDVNLIAGNHDRGTADRASDTEGIAAQTIAWGLKLLGHTVNFDSLVLSLEYDGINYILLHGDKLLSKRDGKTLAWDYGNQGMFNFILEGHLHSRIQKAQSQKLSETTKIVHEDAGQTRRQNCPSVFTGNRYSEYGGWDALGGYLIIENNGSDKPNVFDFTFNSQ